MLGYEGRERLIEQGGIGALRSQSPRFLEKRLVDCCADSDPGHATTMPRLCHRRNQVGFILFGDGTSNILDAESTAEVSASVSEAPPLSLRGFGTAPSVDGWGMYSSLLAPCSAPYGFGLSS